MDLSKAFDIFTHNLSIAKLHARGFQHDALQLPHKVSMSFSSWEELIKGVPQGFVLWTILFDLYLNDGVYLVDFREVCNFADNAFHACDTDLNNLVKRLQHDVFLAIQWFETNNMKLNRDKCHILVSGHKYENIWAKMVDEKIWEKAK